jgi:hypothetical protein
MFKKDDAVYLKEDPSVVGMVKSVDLEKGTCRVVWVDSVSVEEASDLRPADLPHYRYVNNAENDVLIQRKRQREKWTIEHDAEHKDGSLAAVASSLAHPNTRFHAPCGCREAMCPCMSLTFSEEWTPPAPEWAKSLFLKHDRRQRLVIAAALILAEIERIDRETAKS